MKKIRSYTSIWNVEKVLYAINDVNLPFPVTFTQITWFVLTEFIIILFADVPPLSMIEGAFLKYFGIPVALTWFMSQKTFDGKKPYSYIKTMVLYALRPLLLMLPIISRKSMISVPTSAPLLWTWGQKSCSPIHKAKARTA